MIGYEYFCRTEVTYFRLSSLGNQNVARFYISMTDSHRLLYWNDTCKSARAVSKHFAYFMACWLEKWCFRTVCCLISMERVWGTYSITRLRYWFWIEDSLLIFLTNRNNRAIERCICFRLLAWFLIHDSCIFYFVVHALMQTSLHWFCVLPYWCNHYKINFAEGATSNSLNDQIILFRTFR